MRSDISIASIGSNVEVGEITDLSGWSKLNNIHSQVGTSTSMNRVMNAQSYSTSRLDRLEILSVTDANRN